jgi:hypothetical protein
MSRRLLTQRLGHNADPGLGTEGYGTAVEDSHIPGFAPGSRLPSLFGYLRFPRIEPGNSLIIVLPPVGSHQ